jgi:hypothetical protein
MIRVQGGFKASHVYYCRAFGLTRIEPERITYLN